MFYLMDAAKFGQIANDKLPMSFNCGELDLVHLHLA